jgi:hypothetical protein
MEKLKKIFNLYNLGVVACITVIIASLVVIISPKINQSKESKKETITATDENTIEKNEETSKENVIEEKNGATEEKTNENNVETSKENTNEDNKETSAENNEGISEEEARKIAKKKFKEMKEKVKEDQLEVLEIKRDNENYYYISSEKNTMEIRKKDGKITRINSVKVSD